VNWNRGFTGYITDQETFLLHARARTYMPQLGIFIGRDFLENLFEERVLAGYGNGYNLYKAYFVPNGVDPTGHLYTETVTYGPDSLGTAVTYSNIDANFSESEWTACPLVETWLMNIGTAMIPLGSLGTWGAAVISGTSATCCTCYMKIRYKNMDYREWYGEVQIEHNLSQSNRARSRRTGLGPVTRTANRIERMTEYRCTLPFFTVSVPSSWQTLYSTTLPPNPYPASSVPTGVWSAWSNVP